MSRDSLRGVTRNYEMVKRRDKVAETRRRIAQATYELHATIGPAQATMGRIAERSGLPRQTIYRNFPNTLELFRGCIAFGLERHPFPDPAPWATISDRLERLRAGLTEMYAWFELEEGVMTNTMRDRGLFPDAAAAMLPVDESFQNCYEVLAGGWDLTAAAAVVALAIDFAVWKKLRREHRMPSGAIVNFWTDLARCGEVPL